MRNRREEALQSLSKLRRVPPNDARVQAEWRGIIAEVEFQDEMTARLHPNKTGISLELLGWLDLFKKNYIRRTAVAVAIPFFQQFSGINAFVYYAPTFFSALGLGTELSLILSGMVNICQLVANLPTFIYLDRLGRRQLAIWGAVAMGIPLAIQAGIVAKYNASWSQHKGVAWFGVALICESKQFPRTDKTLSSVQISTSYASHVLTDHWHGRCLPKFTRITFVPKA